ncbi:MAG TPA: polysaccharide biosynthesis/export family protein, partial [Oligoflexia bacterium]|nr:polysaccharide biosynthesis/export family protein [Oligoflexia bacterium]
MKHQVHRVSLVLVASLICIELGCLRYVPSRRELAKEGDAPAYAGEEAFYSLERIQEKRLNEIIARRNAERAGRGPSSYRIGAADLIEFTVFDVPELNVKVRVRPAGDITLPLIGSVTAQGKTEAELQDEVTRRLKNFLHSPQVQVYIAEYSANKVWVIGEIQKPGAYPLIRDDYSLIELLAEAGGRTDKASGILILIPDASPGIAEIAQSDPAVRTQLAQAAAHNGIEIHFDDLVGSVSKPPLYVPLRAGDTIVASESGMVQVDGEVNRPGSYQLASRMTLIGAIAAASGLTYSANVKEVEVVRELGSGQKSLITVD